MTALDDAYNNRKHVPDHPALFDAFARESAAFRAASPQAELGWRYDGSERTIIDFFPAANARPGAPLFVFIHGGYWVAHDPSFYSTMAAGVNAHGFDAALIGYDLCPQVTLATIVEQIAAACAALHRRFGRRLVMVGHSAGGHLAAAMAQRDWAAAGLPADLIAAILPVSGVFDLRPLVDTYLNPLLRLDAHSAAQLSPQLAPARAIPCAVVVGGSELSAFVAQSRDFADHWRRIEPRTSLWEIGGMHHFSVIRPLAEPESLLTRVAVAMLSGVDPA